MDWTVDIDFGRGFATDPTGELTVHSQTPSWWGGGSLPQEPHHALALLALGAVSALLRPWLSD